VFGVGGVGSVCAEALARCGVGEITIVDGDIVDITNINRQLPSLHSTIGDDKASVMAKRLKDINTVARIVHHNKMWSKDSAFVNLEEYDYVIDAIDAFRDKIDLIETCINKDIMIISSMGAGGRVKGEMFEISDISKTYNDPLAKKVRTELRKRGIDKLKVVFSKELPIKAIDGVVGSAMFAVASTGLLLAQAVISDLIGEKDG
ncbi:MAG: ThiF family adenylyltransferase, partial [Clostridiales bacterium]|nr:ThiF family adenylyltransferase [Clostridiales bacterium]